jgi:hypothetical protein
MKLISLLLFAAIVYPMRAQPPATPKISGDLTIRYDTRTNRSGDKPKEGVFDTYTLKLNIADSAMFRGTINVLPFIDFMTTDQQGKMTYAMECDVINPANPSQTRNVGRLYGSVPIDDKNVYRFADGNLKIGVNQMGAAQAFESSFKGYALGKPPAAGFMQRMKQEALNLSKTVKGKTVRISVTKYDKMEFKNHVLGAGPVKIYQEVTVNGVMLYDYNRSAWYFQNITVDYFVDGRNMRDTISGNIRWIEAPNRSSTGEGEYQFDIRVNEPPPSEASVFAGPQDESAFFATDNTQPSLTGAMKYKDSMSGESVSSSVVKIDLVGNQLNKQQAMYLSKLLFLSSIVPLNAE